MIKFFRNIRKQLAAQNKTAAYLRYAIGEIILVVIGILIALQINNWNENRLEKRSENKILGNLHSEFAENLKDLENINVQLQETINSMEKIFEVFRMETHPYTPYQIDSLLSESLNSPTWKPSDFVLNELKNSGGLSKLGNEDLKRLLFEWSRSFAELQEIQTQTENTNIELIDYIKQHGSLRNIDHLGKYFSYPRSNIHQGNQILLKEFQFENYIDDKLYILKQQVEFYKTTKSLISKILKLTKTS
ncbi:DUF6090 family protein [Mangrovimonas sp. YM274]|uniref:DUF6090 family protein n=1 Tax=Mangrovimonas sp. YM274 TaxID=3070660 RepID=UPI0027DB86FC|nr:DUF6090 family protein [Mangrovimonas sp. YM274]WMI67870.1 DUF6090 family protein [Mangrovimonas sp. YM274]